ncbi:helix-turn-helix domain-containing protein [Halobacterium wangiae]|uniref:helix-turn-helix domain-containing protein n=1 Tax=Halobacterium wangiae TaxID=2902623 RepID=UPI001E47BECB|nr:helix-turn-helix domain-containing protein [Halobacterium wangiae]
MTDPDTAADAFGVLSDPSRVAILRELTNRGHVGDGSTVEFAELRRAVGFDDAGRFNYHLGKLRDRFVVKREDGYAPTYAGMKAIGSVEAGTYTTAPEPREAVVDHECPQCGEGLTARYEDHLLTVQCEEHDVFFMTAVPPSVADGADVHEIVEFAIGDVQLDLERAVDGTCPVCASAIVPSEFERDDDGHLSVVIDCERCWMTIHVPVGLTVLRHPAVVSLYYDHGVDLRREFPAALEFAHSTDNATIVSEDPTEVELTVDVGADSLTMHVDEELNVTEA